MRKEIGLFVVLVAVICMCAATSGCVVTGGGVGYSAPPASQGPPPWAPAHGARAKYRYHYYPESAIYFDTGRGLYFYLSGGTWYSTVRLPASITIAGAYVALDMDVDKPYKFHNDVIKHHPPGQKKKQEGGPPGKGRGK